MDVKKLQPTYTLNSLLETVEALGDRSLPAVDFAANVIKEAIVSGVFLPGTSIRQDIVARELGISKIPVREALRTLEAENLVQFTQNRGVMVLPSSSEELVDIYELRRVLEPYALQLSIPALTVGDLEDADFILRKERLAKTDLERGRYNRAFHEKILSRCGSSYCLNFISVLLTKSDRYSRIAKVKTRDHLASNEEHRILLNACRERNIRVALKVMDQHLSAAKNILRGAQ